MRGAAWEMQTRSIYVTTASVTRATVRRAERQIRALFCRRTVDIFPPPGPDRCDSFFARTHTPQESHARLYLGVAAQGRSLKVVLLRVYLALLGAAQKWYAAGAGKRNKDNPPDPYMTLLGYFNSLRELGGSGRIIEDEVVWRQLRRSVGARSKGLTRPGQRKIIVPFAATGQEFCGLPHPCPEQGRFRGGVVGCVIVVHECSECTADCSGEGSGQGRGADPVQFAGEGGVQFARDLLLRSHLDLKCLTPNGRYGAE